MKCSAHGEFLSSICNWCGSKICDVCVDEADGKKYCADCIGKVKAQRLESEPSWGSPPMEKIKNVDDSLSEDRVKQIREMLAKRIHS